MVLSCVERETGPNPRHAIVWLHGLGADGNDFAPIVPELVDRAWPALRFVFPHAPVRPITICMIVTEVGTVNATKVNALPGLPSTR